MSVVRHMFYGSFGTQNSMVISISKFDPGKVNVRSDQVEKGQISKFKIYVQKHAYNSQFCLRVPKMLFILMCNNQKCHKLHFKKVTSPPLPVLFCHCIAKNRDVAMKFCMRVVCMYLDNEYSVFLNILEMLDFMSNYF